MKMMIPALLFCACLLQEPTIEELIRRLDSDNLQERELAGRQLKARGKEAALQLEKAVQREGPEVAARAKRLLELVAIVEREQLTADLLAELPGMDERLQSQGDQAWGRVFLDKVSIGQQSLKDATWSYLAPRAVKGAKTVEERAKICKALLLVPVPEAAAELMTYFLQPLTEFRDPDDLLFDAVNAMARMNARLELYRVVTEYGNLSSEKRRTNPNVAYRAFEALAELRARPELLKLAQQAESFTAGQAVQELAKIEHPDRTADLLKLLSIKNPFGRHYAALALGTLGVREAVAPLTALLSEPDGPTLRGAMTALAQLGAREAAPQMLPLMKDSRSWVAAIAMRSVAELGEKSAILDLQALLTDKDAAVRAIAGESLARLRGKEAAEDLLPLIKDPDPSVRVYIGLALSEAGSPKGLPTLLRAAEKGEPLMLNVGDQMSGGSLEFPPLPLLGLNALRSPETWTRFLKAMTPSGLKGTLVSDADLIAKHLRLKPVLSDDVAKLPELMTRRYFFSTPPSMRLFLLMTHFCASDVHLILDGDAMRLVTRAEAVADWKRWFVACEPADAEDRAQIATYRQDLLRLAMAPAEREALEQKERAEAKAAHRKERSRSLEGLLGGGLKKYEDRLLDGTDETWAQIALEIVAKPETKSGLTPAELNTLAARGVAAEAKSEEKVKILSLAQPVRGQEIPTWIQDLLRAADNGTLRMAAVRLLNGKDHQSVILELANDPAPGVREAVADQIRETNPAEYVRILIDLSQLPDWRTCDRATMLLSYQSGPELIPLMIGQLKRSTSNFNAAHSALRYLGRQGAREAIPSILPLLEQERPTCMREALQALLELGAREDMPRILRAARKMPLHGFQTVQLIEAFDVRPALADLYACLDSDNDYRKGDVCIALARMGQRDALPAIRKLLHHEYGELRKEACTALALLEGPQARQDVLEVFEDPKVEPTSALLRLQARDALPELSKRLTQYNPGLIEAIVELGGREALPRIFGILDKPDLNSYFVQGLQAVARVYPKESIPTLRINLGCKVYNNPEWAAAMLCETGSAEGVPLLIEKQWPTFSLNAVRRPEAWQRLRDLRIDQTLYGSGHELLTRVAGEVGLKVEGLPADAAAFKAWTGYHHFLPKGARPLRLIEVLERLEDQRWAFILEKDVIRVVPRDVALAFWKEWSTPAQKK